MVEVTPRDDSELLIGAIGAFVNVLTWAADSDEFREKARELMEQLRLDIVGIDNAEPLAHRGPEEELNAEIVRISAEVRYNREAIMYSTFHTWGPPVQ